MILMAAESTPFDNVGQFWLSILTGISTTIIGGLIYWLSRKITGFFSGLEKSMQDQTNELLTIKNELRGHDTKLEVLWSEHLGQYVRKRIEVHEQDDQQK